MRSVLCLVLVVLMSSCCAMKGKKQCKMDCANPCCAAMKHDEAAVAVPVEAAVVPAEVVAAPAEAVAAPAEVPAVEPAI
jgi:hypothetical protein